jgi:branched-chain amino acid transport system ATP-binding protein
MTLEVRHLVKHFDGVKAVNGVSFEVRAGECVALIGPNGAGKSTCFACIAGQHRLSAGEVLWNGERIDGLPPAQRLARGVARTFQVAQTFEALTVLENVQLLLSAPQGLAAWNALKTTQMPAAQALLEQVGLQGLAQADVLGLPYGAKKRLELAMALAGVPEPSRAASPRLLLLDEPAAGLASSERAALMTLVKSLARGQGPAGDRGDMAVLYTEHNMDAVFGVADRVLVLIEGELAAQGTPDEIAQNETVRSRYLGYANYAVRAGHVEVAVRTSTDSVRTEGVHR